MDENLRNIKMVIAYEGTAYAGFQRQRSGILTIQGVLEECLQKIGGATVTLNGAGRTDAGVHAQGQVVNFLTRSQLSTAKLLLAMNAVLPKDIVVKSAEEVDQLFHARFSAKSKIYSYRLYNDPIRPVFGRNFVYHYRYSLNVEQMQVAAELLLGQQDFQSFQAAGSVITNTVRTIEYSAINQKGPEIRYEVKADGFLYHMVRNIVGTLLLVGCGKMTLKQFETMLLLKDRSAAGPTAPASGLCLERVFY